MGNLFGRMAVEAKARPAVTPNVDDAFAALAKAGYPIGGLEQSLGSTYKARYCKHGLTAKQDLSVNVCEYADPAAAAIGLAESKTVFPGIVQRQSFSHKALMMAIIQQNAKSGPETQVAQAKILATFNAL
jgi:hypothetical protein